MCPMSNGFAPINLAMLLSYYCLNWHNEDQSAQQNCLNTGQCLDIFKLSRIHVRSKCNTIDQESSVSCEIKTYRHLKNSSLTKFACGYNASHMWALHKRQCILYNDKALWKLIASHLILRQSIPTKEEGCNKSFKKKHSESASVNVATNIFYNVRQVSIASAWYVCKDHNLHSSLLRTIEKEKNLWERNKKFHLYKKRVFGKRKKERYINVF